MEGKESSLGINTIHVHIVLFYVHRFTKRSTNLIVGHEASLTGERSSRSRSTSRSSHSCVGGSQAEVVAVGWETNQQLLSGGTIALPVVHSVVLLKKENELVLESVW